MVIGWRHPGRFPPTLFSRPFSGENFIFSGEETFLRLVLELTLENLIALYALVRLDKEKLTFAFERNYFVEKS